MAWSGHTDAPVQLRGWQITFVCFGAPGVLLAAWVMSFREPRRGGASSSRSGGAPHPAVDHRHAFGVLGSELLSNMPLFNIAMLRRHEARLHLTAGATALTAGIASVLSWATGDVAQVRSGPDQTP